MLFHSLADPAAEMYIEQGVCTLIGDLDPEAFQAAWQYLSDRHATLRTAFFWKGLSKPVQVIYQKNFVPFRHQDLADRNEAERHQIIAEQMKSDRTLLSALDQAPLMRVTIFRLDRERWQVLWSIHHLIHDAWSLSVMLREVLTAYESFRAGRRPALSPVSGYQDYVKWLKKNDQSCDPLRVEQFWRRHLAGFQLLTPIPWDGAGSAAAGPHSYHTIAQVLEDGVVAALTTAFRRRQLTLNTIVLAAWAMVLGFNTGLPEVVFGAVTSGRPVDLPGVDSIAGLFIRTLPFRVTMQFDQDLPTWLTAIQRQQLEIIAYEQTPLSQIRKWSELPAGCPLFESLVVYQSAFEGLSGLTTAGLTVLEMRSEGHPHYPLMFRVTPGRQIQLEIVHDTRRLSGTQAGKLLRQLAGIVREMARRPMSRLADLRRSLQSLEDEEEIRQKSQRRARFAQSFSRIKPLPVSSQAAPVGSKGFERGGNVDCRAGAEIRRSGFGCLGRRQS
jgi:hypothetical protein